MKSIIYTLALVGCLGWMACEKAVLPEPTQEGIPFGMKGELNGEIVQLSLDNPGYKMETNHLFNDTIWIFSGHLKPKVAINNMLPELEIHFRNLDFGIDSNIQADRFKNISWQWFDESKTRIFHPLHIRVVAADTSADWTLQLQNRWTISNRRDFSLLLPNREQARIQLKYESQKGRGTIGLIVKPDNNQPQKLPIANWLVQQLDSVVPMATLHARLTENQPNPALQYLWSGGETTQLIHINNPGIYSVSITDNTGKQFWHSKTLGWNPQLGEFVDPMREVDVFSHWSPPVQEPDRFQPGSFTLRLKDKFGNWYTSNTPQQNSKIDIIEVKPFQINEFGQRTVAIKINIHCRLKAEHKNEWVNLTNFNGWIAVAIP